MGVATECGNLNFLHEFATECRLLIIALYADALIISQQVWIFPL
jgi:hydrogenase maturation factor